MEKSSPHNPIKQMNFQGRTLLITRPSPEAERTAQQIRACHGHAILSPALTIQPPDDKAALQAAMQRVHTYDGILLTSAHGANVLTTAVAPGQTPPPLFAVGEKTAGVLRKRGWKVDTPAIPAGGEALAQAIMGWQASSNQHFLFLQAEQGRDELTTLLQQAGYRVDRVAAYRAEAVTTLSTETQSALAKGEVDAILFFSGRSAQAFVAALPSEGKGGVRNALIAVISPVTGQAVQALGYTVTVTAHRPNSEGLLQALHHYWHPMPAHKNPKVLHDAF